MTSKELYIDGVIFTLRCMIDLWLDKENNDGYSFISDLKNYSETIEREGVLKSIEFEVLIIQVLKEKGIQKGTLT